MRIAVLSDIHANLLALEAVLGEIEAASVDAVWCLGDVVGYGPQPSECVALVRERTDVCLCGNHDLAVLGRLELQDFSADAAAAVRWTRKVLDGEAAAWLRTLEPARKLDDAELFHGSPRDAVWDYVLSEASAVDAFARTTTSLVVVGHSHVALALRHDGETLGGGLAPAGTSVKRGRGRLLLNPGSVGQPRDGDPRAAWLLLDGSRASFHRVKYDIESVQAAIRTAGLPDPLASRLAIGA